MGNWKKTQAIITLPPAIKTAGAVLQELAQTAVQVAQILQSALAILVQLAILDLTVAQILVKAAVGVLEQVVRDLLKDTGLYVLFVPVGRRLPIPSKVQDEMRRLGISTLPFPSVAFKEFEIDVSTLPTDTVNFLKGVGYAQGGNAGFFQTVVASTLDPGDKARPQFGPYDFVAGVQIVIGASDFLVLIPLIRQLTALFGPLHKSRPLFQDVLPVPTNVSARLAPSSSGKIGVVLQWSIPQPIVPIGGTGNHAVLTKLIIIRSTNPKLRSATDYWQLFVDDPREGLDTGEYDAKILKVLDISPLNFTATPDSYVDTAGLELGKDYYYTLCYSGKIGPYAKVSVGGGENLEPGSLTSVVRVHYEEYVPIASRGTPPNWIRTPSVMSLVPGVNAFLGTITKAVHQWGHTVEGFNAILAGYANWLNLEIASYTELAVNLTRRINILVAILNSAGAVGIYMRTFQSPSSEVSRGRGGNQFLFNDLALALSDPEGPPFWYGNEYVAGMVLVAGGPSLDAIQPVLSALNILMGIGSAQAQVIQDAVKAIGVAVTDGERIFAPNFTWIPAATTTIGPTGTPVTKPYVPPVGGTRYPSDGSSFGPWDQPPNFPSIGNDDRGNCPLLKKGMTVTPVVFGLDMKVKA